MPTDPTPLPNSFVTLLRHVLSQMEPKGITLALQCCIEMQLEDFDRVRPVQTTFDVLRGTLLKTKWSLRFVESIIEPFHLAGYISTPTMIFDANDVVNALDLGLVDRICADGQKSDSFAATTATVVLKQAFASRRIHAPRDMSWVRGTTLPDDLLLVLASREDIPTEHLVATTRGLLQVVQQVIAWRMAHIAGLDVGLDLTSIQRPSPGQCRPLIPTPGSAAP
jgi:hypothetical protein